MQVYTSAGLIATFAVPSGQAGNLWTVFEMTGSLTNPVITPRNEMGNISEPSGITSPPAMVGLSPIRGNDASLISRAVKERTKPKQ